MEQIEHEEFIGQLELEESHVEYSSTKFIVDGECIGTPFNLKLLVQAYGKDIIPSKLGIYHLFYNDQLVYVGMSKNLRNRLLGHLRDEEMPFNYCLWFCADRWREESTVEDILRVEYNMIKRFKPVLNSAHLDCR